MLRTNHEWWKTTPSSSFRSTTSVTTTKNQFPRTKPRRGIRKAGKNQSNRRKAASANSSKNSQGRALTQLSAQSVERSKIQNSQTAVDILAWKNSSPQSNSTRTNQVYFEDEDQTESPGNHTTYSAMNGNNEPVSELNCATNPNRLLTRHELTSSSLSKSTKANLKRAKRILADFAAQHGSSDQLIVSPNSSELVLNLIAKYVRYRSDNPLKSVSMVYLIQGLRLVYEEAGHTNSWTVHINSAFGKLLKEIVLSKNFAGPIVFILLV